jgi:hypothetical protein
MVAVLNPRAGDVVLAVPRNKQSSSRTPPNPTRAPSLEGLP